MSYKKQWLKTIRYEIESVTQSPLALRDGDEDIKRDSMTGRFIIPGSSIAGAFRNYYERYIVNEGESNLLFSKQNTGMNTLYCYDALQREERSQISSRPGLMINLNSMTGHTFGDEKESGSKFNREFIPEGAKFQFIFELQQYEEDYDMEKAINQVERLIKAFVEQEIALGAHKKIGFGIFRIIEVHKESFDFAQKADFVAFLRKENKKCSIMEQLKQQKVGVSKIRFFLEANTRTPLLIRDEVLRSHEAPDGQNMMNGLGEYIIPGSSIKGIFRNRILRILASYKNLDTNLAQSLFGVVSKNGDEGSSSALSCFDSIVQQAKSEVYHKIKLDHFTGGVMQGALMNEEVIMGKTLFSMTLDRKANLIKENNEEARKLKKEMALILCVLQELAKGELSIGSGYSVGRGYFEGVKLKIEADQEYVYEFNNPDIQVVQVFNQWFDELWQEVGA